MSDEERRIGDQLSHTLVRIVDRFAETYCGPKNSEKLKWGWRFSNSLAGSSVLYVLSVPFSQLDSYMRIAPGTPYSQVVLNFNMISNVMLFLVPTVLSLVMASGIKNGGPMRFFFTGFFVTAMMLGVVSLVRDPQTVVPMQNLTVPMGQQGHVPVPGGGYVPVPGGGYVPVPGGGYVPVPGGGYVPVPGGGYVPVPGGGYVPVPGVELPQVQSSPRQ